MNTMLDELHRAFSQQRAFVANAAHELKTPIAILKSTLQSLLQRSRSADEYRAGLEQALEDMQRLEQLLHMMLRLARAEQASANAASHELELVDVVATCRSAVDLVQPLLAERNLSIKFLSNGALPINANAEDLRLVWSNLLDNAVRFSPTGGEILFRAERDGARARIEVEDSGPGIPAGELARVFERFLRPQSPPRPSSPPLTAPGTGWPAPSGPWTPTGTPPTTEGWPAPG